MSLHADNLLCSFRLLFQILACTRLTKKLSIVPGSLQGLILKLAAFELKEFETLNLRVIENLLKQILFLFAISSFLFIQYPYMFEFSFLISIVYILILGKNGRILRFISYPYPKTNRMVIAEQEP